MKYYVIMFALFILGCAIQVKHQQNVADKGLSKFVGQPAISVWSEVLSTGETRHYTRWNNCVAVIGEYDNSYFYITQPHCDNKESV